MGAPRTAIYASLIGLTAVALSIDTQLDQTQREANLRSTEKSPPAASPPAKIRLELPISLVEQTLTLDRLRRSDPGRLGIDDQPITRVRLVDSEYFVADWRNGRVQYVLKGVSPWGASVGGQFNTSTAKVTLTWSFND